MQRGAVYLGVDVGTGSARAALCDGAGTRLGMGVQEIRTWRPAEDHVEQSSDDIWAAVCVAVRTAVQEADLDAKSVRGIGFDATCSLVALGSEDRPVSISTTEKSEQNVIVWMDHRAMQQAERITEGGHPVLRYVGGRVSPEMQIPKLLWLKEELPRCWSRAVNFFDLPDFLSYRATGEATRSFCTTVCKWNYDAPEGRWDRSYFESIGLECFVEEGFVRIGNQIRPVGDRVGNLEETAADELGLSAGIPVAVSLIDAHAGGVGLLGTPLDGKALEPADFEHRLALIGGTSSCHMAVSPEPRFIEGVWGPYLSAMLDGYWLTEAGQSATGALIDHVIDTHVRGAELRSEAERQGTSAHAILGDRLRQMAGDMELSLLTDRMHVLPYFHGNRSPRANPELRGMVSGLRLTDSIESLALYYLATIQGIAYGTRHILSELNRAGYSIDTLIACGGGTKNEIFLQEHANATACNIVLPKESEAVLLGAAMLGAVACGDHETLPEAMAEMSHMGRVVERGSDEAQLFSDAKYEVFLRMHDDQLAYDDRIDRA